jgi:beta-glucosidase
VPQLGLNDYSVRWTGALVPKESGSFVVGTLSDDGARLWVDGKLVVDRWVDQAATAATTTLDLVAGRSYDIRLEFYQAQGFSSVHLLYSRPDDELIAEALAVARAADIVVLALGNSPEIEGEEMGVYVDGFAGGDRTKIDLPAVQDKLLKQVMALGKPTALVLMNGGALAVNWASENVPAIVEAWYPGQRGGDAVADVLFGDYNPAGRLPVTFYRSLDQIPAFTDYGVAGRTYRYFNGDPLYPFGFGLSYTQFRYANVALSKPVIDATESVVVEADVQNAGAVAGDEVVQVYVSHDAPGRRAPIRALRGIQRVHLAAGEKSHVQFTLGPDDFALAGDSLQKEVVPGKLHIAIGGKQPGFSGQADARTTESVLVPLEIKPSSPAH